VISLFVTQGSPEHEDVLRQVTLLNVTVRPNSIKEFPFLDYAISVLYQNKEGFEGFRRKLNGLLFLQQEISLHINAEGAEFVKSDRGTTHESLRSSKKF
jgi:hypothetical protein